MNNFYVGAGHQTRVLMLVWLVYSHLPSLLTQPSPQPSYSTIYPASSLNQYIYPATAPWPSEGFVGGQEEEIEAGVRSHRKHLVVSY